LGTESEICFGRKKGKTTKIKRKTIPVIITQYFFFLWFRQQSVHRCCFRKLRFLDALHSVSGTQEQTYASLKRKVKQLGTPGAVCYTQDTGIGSPQSGVAARYDALSQKK